MRRNTRKHLVSIGKFYGKKNTGQKKKDKNTWMVLTRGVAETRVQTKSETGDPTRPYLHGT